MTAFLYPLDCFFFVHCERAHIPPLLLGDTQKGQWRTQTKVRSMATAFSMMGIAGVLVAFAWFSARQTANMTRVLMQFGEV